MITGDQWSMYWWSMTNVLVINDRCTGDQWPMYWWSMTNVLVPVSHGRCTDTLMHWSWWSMYWCTDALMHWCTDGQWSMMVDKKESLLSDQWMIWTYHCSDSVWTGNEILMSIDQSMHEFTDVTDDRWSMHWWSMVNVLVYWWSMID